MAGTVHEIYAVKFGSSTHGTRGRYFMGDAAVPADEPTPVDYFVWAIRSDLGDIVLDAGWTAETNRGRPRVLIENPTAALRRIGVDPTVVETVLLSHFHNDHVGDVDGFARARFVAQKTEFDFWTSDIAWHPDIARHTERDDVDRLVALREAGRLELVDGEAEIADGVSVVHVGGHTPGSQVVVVRTARGPVVLAADAAHFFENIELDRPFAVHTNLPEYCRALIRMRGLGSVAAGHDPELFTRFDSVPGLEGRAVRVA